MMTVWVIFMQIEFLRPMTASILSERRAIAPFGLLGGGSALTGINLLLRKDGRAINLGSKSSVAVDGGDRLRILTPGPTCAAFLYCWNDSE